MFTCLWNLFDWLEQPVTSATPGMDNKKVVQTAAAVSMPVSVRGKGDVSSGAAAVVSSGTSVSGVRRRSGSQGLRSPAAKRPVSAPVALQGWLHKQGSEGLMLWKKRWFVLSEYCLFYYKGPEEEKLLGSILLPSYRITVCKPEDKVNKKFAFKAEHANMRTYHFAADSREAMNQWVNALTLATLLQDPSPGVGEAAMVIEIAGQHGANGDRSARPSVSSISSILNQSADDSDSGFHGFQSRDDPSHASNNNSSPNSVNTASFPNLTGNGANNGNNNNDACVTNNANNEIPPMVNGWIQQQQQQQHHVSHSQLNTSQHQQQQQYGQSMPSSQEQSHHSHSYQAMLRQHFAYSTTDQSQNYQYKRAVQQQQQQQQQQSQSRLITSGNVQTVQPMPRKFGQPIYANAPPKPRRLTDGSTEYSTPSPDPDCGKPSVSPDVTSTGKSPLSDYEKNSLIYGTRTGQPSQQQASRTDKLGLNYGTNMSTGTGYGQGQQVQIQVQERRTPDTYGRSAAKPRSSRGNGDYEDVYGTPQLYQRPAGPVGYAKGSSPAPIPIPIPVYAQQQHHQHQIHSPVSVSSSAAITRQARAQPPPRPHSADFLEYESSRKPHQQLTPTTARCEESVNQLQRRPQRPKSSLDIVATSDAMNDGYFYSEERYAAQMRQSAVYLHQTPQQHQQRRNQSLSRATIPSNETETGTGLEADMETRTEVTGMGTTIRDETRVSTLPESLRNSGFRREHVHQQHAMPHQSFQRHIELSGSEGSKLRRSLRDPSYESSASIRETMMSQVSDTRDTDGIVDSVRRIPRRDYEWGVRPAARVGPTCHAASNRRWNEQQQQQQFCRSASVRLPRTRHPAAFDPDDEDYGEPSSEQDSRDGERKIQQREESMKRLLEWKQRMLQSPLTRKPSASMNRGRGRNEQLSSYYKQQALLELAAQEASVAAAGIGTGGIDEAEARHSRRRDDGHRAHVRSKSSDARRNVANVPRYNSYSSDDEASGSGSVIGRDPLPPRAVSTSQLAQRRSPQIQPPAMATVSTLPLTRNNATHRQSPLLLHQSTPRSARQSENDFTDSHLLRVASSGDVVGTGSSPVMNNFEGKDTRLSSSMGRSTIQRLTSPASQLRHVPFNDRRVSSSCDSDVRVHSPIERQMASPIGREADRSSGSGSGSGRGSVTRQNQYAWECNELLQKRARLAELDTPRRLENLRKLDELKKHLMDLEKQYEKGKPLVNLVDNMVKLGSLYNPNTVNGIGSVTGAGSRHDLTHDGMRDHRLEFNQKIQEQRLLAEERRDWNRLSPDHGQLQAKVQQLYKLDRLLQEESGTLHSLQQDKEMLEKALGGLRHKLQGNRSNLAETERYRKQQLLLERELSRVRALLAHNSKKLEETVAENARLEQELVVLRQKLQASRRYAGNVTRDTSATTGPLEAELRRVQQLVGDLQRQRKELSVQVRQLTEKSHSLVQQIRPQPSPGNVNATPQVHQSKKRTQNSWLETDLDSGITLDHGLDSPSSPSLSSSPCGKQNGGSYLSHYGSTMQIKDPSPTTRQQLYQHPHRSHHMSSLAPQLREQIHQHQLKQQLLKDQMQGKGSMMQANVAPLYVNTDSRIQENGNQEERLTNGTISPPEYIPPPPPPPLPLNDENSLNDNYRQYEENKFAGSSMHNREKQEIKTVRIVKRESERRQRDRGDRTGNIGIPLTNGLQVPGGAKRISDEDLGGSQKFEKGQLGKVIEEPPMIHAQSTVQLTELDDVQFQRSMSLPRGFGGQRHQHHRQPEIHQVPVVPPPRSDSMNALRTMLARRNKLRFDYQDGSSDSTLSPYTESLGSSSYVPIGSPNYSTSSPSYSPSQQSYPPVRAGQSPRYYPPPAPAFRQYETHRPRVQEPTSPESFSPMGIDGQGRTFDSTLNVNAASNSSPQLSPVFKSEAAKQIIKEMTERKVDGPRRRQIPREKRRHYTVSSSKPILDLEDTFAKMGMGRARDDLDMERALRPRINAPDVVRSTLSHKELKYNESTIDQLLGTPNKIVIPERYIPEQTPELSAEEQEQRLKKAEAIRKMLSETTVTAPDGNDDSVVEQSDNLKKKVVEEKRQRDHILQLNQILAKQVMEKSKMVAVNALATLPLKTESSLEDEDLSPVTPLPLYQQRENYYS